MSSYLQQQSHPSYRRYSTLPLHGHHGRNANITSPVQPEFEAHVNPAISQRAPPRPGADHTPQLAGLAHRNIYMNDPVVRSHLPIIDYHNLDYVTDCDENLTCPICIAPLVDPAVLEACGHTFCRSCLRQSWQATGYFPGIPKGSCPTCRSQTRLAGRGAVSKILVNILDELLVRCPMSTQGCTAKVRRGVLRDHVNAYCDHVLVECPSPSCHLQVRRVDSLRNICLHSDASCSDCKQIVSVPMLEAHWHSHCADRTITCEHCEAIVFNRQKEVHLEKDCLGVPTECAGSAFGCQFSARKCDVQQHSAICPIAAMVPFLQAQKATNDQLIRDHALLSRKVDILEGGFQSLHDLLTQRPPPRDLSAEPTPVPASRTPPLPPTSRFAAPTRDRISRAFRTSSRSRSASATHTPSQSPNRHRRQSGHIAMETIDTAVASSNQNHSTPVLPPYASPQHHLLALHETLREEVLRVSNAIHELDGRHSLLIMNENMRLADEVAYLRNQMGGLGRQLGWLTSSRLADQQRSSSSPTSANVSSSTASAGNILFAAASVANAASSQMRTSSEIPSASSSEVRTEASSGLGQRGISGIRRREERGRL